MNNESIKKKILDENYHNMVISDMIDLALAEKDKEMEQNRNDLILERNVAVEQARKDEAEKWKKIVAYEIVQAEEKTAKKLGEKK